MTSLARALRLVRPRPQSVTATWEPALTRATEVTNRSFSTALTQKEFSRKALATTTRHSCLPQQQTASCRNFSSKDEDDKDKAASLAASEDAPAEEFQIPGAQAGGKKLAMVYTCTVCNTRSIKQFSEHSYQNGVVLVRCPGCQNLHLIADHLGMFDDSGDWDIQKAMAKLGQDVNVVNNENVLELNLQDLMGQDAIEKLAKGVDTTSKAEEEEEQKKS